MDIPGAAAQLQDQFMNRLSVSPEASKSYHSQYAHPQRHRTYSASMPRALRPYVSKDVKVLLLENVNETGQDILRKQGFVVEAVKSSLPKAQLIEKIKCVWLRMI